MAIPASGTNDGRWAESGELVIPCFPSQHTGAFLAVPSFRLAARARVSEEDVDPDTLADALAKEYPGLPRKLIENYILETYKAVAEDADGTEYGVVVGQDQALLVNKTTGRTKQLWEKQPVQ